MPRNLFRKSLSNLTKGLDYDIYSYLWDETGRSLNHGNINFDDFREENARKILIDYMTGFNLKKISSESYLQFKKNLQSEYKELIESDQYHFGTINSIPQIYSLSKCFDLILKNLNDYDLIFKCRFDTLFLHPLNVYDLEKFRNEKAIYSINFGRAYYPKRIYDIFFGGSKESMMFLRNIWEDLPNLLVDKFDNNLDKRDACRIFYLAAIKEDIVCKSFDTRVCDVFRNFDNNYYEKYIISMHLFSIKNIFKNIKFIRYFFLWFRFRKLSRFSIFYSMLLSLILLPISYLKRVKKLFI
tara:strand:- start:325 stop:1218 length:894 start_codon:yes stop_codon:yes gene_type:complete